MEIKPLQVFPRATVEQLLASIPFYKSVKQQDEWQFELLLQQSRIIHFNPGEVVLRRGEQDSWLYFLLKGKLLVYPDEYCEAQPINVITPGEVFGDLAMLVGKARTATLIADSACKQVVVFSSDISIFGELSSTWPITLPTKLAYYRNTVHNLRWKLEVYRAQHPEHVFANRHRQVRLYTGPKDTFAELQSLHEQARELAQLLLEWNSEFYMPAGTDRPSEKLLSSLNASN